MINKNDKICTGKISYSHASIDKLFKPNILDVKAQFWENDIDFYVFDFKDTSIDNWLTDYWKI